jgi:hypothetical protein
MHAFFTGLNAPALQSDAAPDAALVIAGLLTVALSVALLAALWRIVAKAGRPGWISLIPLYNLVVLLQIIGRPWWYLVFLCFPPAAAVLAVVLLFGVTRSFGKGWPFAIGMVFLPFVFIPILAFGGAGYVGPMGPSYRRGQALPRQA